jgi:hypothetical protein
MVISQTKEEENSQTNKIKHIQQLWSEQSTAHESKGS